MGDLVERLRHDAAKARREWPEMFCVSEDLADKAADEIERLRAALRSIEGVGSQYSFKSVPAWAMRNIARAALAGDKIND